MTVNSGKRVTISDVAKAADCSISTVSRVIHNHPRVQPELAARIKAAIDTLGFVPDQSAQWLKTGRSYQILHVVPDIMNPYYAGMYRTIRDVVGREGYQVVLFDTAESEEKELEAISLFQKNSIDGMIFGSVGRSDSVLNALMNTCHPVVLTSQFHQSSIDAFYGVGGRGIYMTTRHLIEMGHKKIAYVGGLAQSMVNQQRKKGYLQAMSESGLKVDSRHIFEMDFTMECGYRAGIFLMSIADSPTAICCANDMIAMGVMQAMVEKGIQIPDDVSLTGEDDIDFARICRPALTTIHNRSDYVGEKVAEMLLDRIEGTYTGPARIHALTERQLMIRETTAAPKHKEDSKE